MEFGHERYNREILTEILNDGSVEKELTFELSQERDRNGDLIKGKCYWLKIAGVEGKLYGPQDSNSSLVLFEPGMPGDSAAWFEENHVQTLVESGYHVLVMRHLGTKTDTERSDVLIHCPERVAKGDSPETRVIGQKQQYALTEMAEEPAIAINSIGKNFDKIAMVGHSAGALHNAYSLNRIHPELQNKISNFISLSGFLGGRDEGRTENFVDLEGYYKYCSQFINMGDAHENTKLVQEIFEEVYKHPIPENIMVTQVNSPEDEYIAISGAEKFQRFLGRGLNITDKTQSMPEFHDLKNLKPETLLRLLEMHYPKSKHTTVFRRK